MYIWLFGINITSHQNINKILFPIFDRFNNRLSQSLNLLRDCFKILPIAKSSIPTARNSFIKSNSIIFASDKSFGTPRVVENFAGIKVFSLMRKRIYLSGTPH